MKIETREAKMLNPQPDRSQSAGDGSVSAIESAPSVRFSIVAKVITQVGARCGIEVPGFKSPPRSADLDRTVRRQSSGSVVAVRIRDRPFEAVIADMIEGVILCNDVPIGKAGKLRNIMWSAVMQSERQAGLNSKHKRTVVVHHPIIGDNVEAA
mgnify:FL=1|tara:strand:- start:791 stop:1252 length:462 start_codon:yes stop_codon:yes gene_type:complete